MQVPFNKFVEPGIILLPQSDDTNIVLLFVKRLNTIEIFEKRPFELDFAIVRHNNDYFELQIYDDPVYNENWDASVEEMFDEAVKRLLYQASEHMEFK